MCEFIVRLLDAVIDAFVNPVLSFGSLISKILADESGQFHCINIIIKAQSEQSNL